MYAVELGAAMLLQFETADGIVRILADAGRKSHRVNDRLGDSIKAFGGDKLRIDLIVGTHYDADHLDGLVDVIENPGIEIGEAWLPPVANDTEFALAGSPLRDESLLALQLAGEDGQGVLRRYLADKAATCSRLAGLEREADRMRGIDARPRQRAFEDDSIGLDLNRSQRDDVQLGREYFEAHIADAGVTIGRTSSGHAEDDITDPWKVDEQLKEYGERARWWHDDPFIEERVIGHSHLAHVEAQTLGLIRESTAKDAITASSLALVVEALKARSIRIRCATIEDGKPQTFGWVKPTGQPGRFERALPADPDSPKLILLGPSQGLVNKFRHLLPTGSYLMAARLEMIPIASITPSNQLSYIMVVEHADQRILVSGHAGANDFKVSGSPHFHAALIEQLAPLHIVQVAHHGGANAYFYRALLASGYPRQAETTRLLLSHATLDSHRPSDNFIRFIAALQRTPATTQVLFTSKPKEAKVRDVLTYIAPVVGAQAMAGDLTLIFDGGWSVGGHVVSVP